MKTKQLLFTTLLFALAFTAFSCSAPNKSDTIDAKEGYLGMNVPTSFDFSTTKEVEIHLSAQQISAMGTVAEVYNGNPHRGSASLVRRLFVRGGATFSTRMNLPSHLTEVWVVSRQNDGIKITHQVPIIGNRAIVDLAEIGAFTSSFSDGSTTTASPECDQNISGNGFTISDGQTYCVAEGDVLTGTILFDQNGGALKVYGTAQLSNFNVNGNPNRLEIHVEETGVFQINTLNINSREGLLVNRGVLQISNGLAFNYTFINYSEVSLSPFNVNSNEGKFYNHGTLNVAGNLNNSNFVHNKGTINVSGSFNNNSNSTLINECRIIATGDFHQNAMMEHYGYIKANGTFYVQQSGSGESLVFGHSLIEAGSSFINRSLTAPNTGAYARMNIQNNIQVNGGGSVLGLMDLCVSSGQISNNGSINNTVTYCEAFIPETNCNPGAGTPPSGPGDGENPPEDEDEYPDDPDRTFNNPYPAAGVFGTLAYEDLWPSYGDYDMNDLVVGYHINEITNSDNKVVDIEFICVIRAIGATLDSGFGIEFPVAASRIQQVVGTRYTEGLISNQGNGTEVGQSNAVVIFWDNSAYEMGKYVNTTNPANHVQEDTLRITVTFNPPIDPLELGGAPYKPFIFVNNDRSLEIHLPGKSPTTLADKTLFGFHDDNSSVTSERFYKSVDNLNWAINIPETIPYPLESIEIIEAYPNFQSWAESGGLSNPDWYLDLPGNRVPSKLYKRP
jgi:LruC domain-containing protein